METAVYSLMGVELLGLVLLYFLGRGHVSAGLKPDGGKGGEPLLNPPKAAVIIPMTGDSPEMRSCLKSIINQDYPGLETVLATRDEADPATALARDLAAKNERVRHVLAGPADRCGQKPHNQLAGLAVLDPEVEVFVFCDSNHLAPKGLVLDLVRPLAKEGAVISSGYHRIIPEDSLPGTLGMCLTLLAMHCMQGISFLTQPWGGAMAIKRSDFERMGVAQVWAENVVDDVSLTALALKSKIRCAPVSRACFETRMGGRSIKSWSDWLTRQIMYLKFCMPGTWVPALLAALVLGGPVLWSAGAILGASIGLVSARNGLAGVVFLLALAAISSLYRSLVPGETSRTAFAGTFILVPPMALWCYLKTWTTNIMSWRDFSYLVGKGGKVLKIIPNRKES